MDLELLIATSGFVLLIGYVVISTCINKYKLWIKKEQLVILFPSWQGTNKPFVWWIIWSFIEFLSIPLFIALTMRGGVELIIAPFIFTCIYIVIIHIIYAIVFLIVKSSLNKK